ncbi:unnamed protein product [Rotaria magnacalcarata]
MELQEINREVVAAEVIHQKLNDIVKSVNNRSGISQRKIGRRFHVHHSTISRNLRRRTSIRIRKRQTTPKMDKRLNEKNVPFVIREDNPPNVPQARPIETVWTLLERKVYENNWEAKNLDVLARRIKKKSKELDQKMLQDMIDGVKMGQIGDID